MHSINFYNFEETGKGSSKKSTGELPGMKWKKQFLAGRQSVQRFITSRKDRRKGKTRSE